MIKLRHIDKSFVTNDLENKVLNNINLDIQKKDVFGLVGKTGSGKSTLIRLMNGFILPDAGEIYLTNELLTKKNRHQLVKKTSMIFQNFNLLNNLTVLENVLLPIRIRKKDRKLYLNKASELLSFVGLEDKKMVYIKHLSGGEKQRVAIARALMTDPEIIFCDEPTSALDEKVSYEVLSLLKKINQTLETTIVIISHDINVIKMLCTKVAILEDGTIKEVIKRVPEDIKPLDYKEALAHV
ncbi:MAG: ATP-binding cassette domain-containing protein [Candidatus Phytoplasma sp.]|nr:ATP-binding cassette domain-containing protein [Phytoplasma sp.]